MPRLLYGVSPIGLGHATRSLVIIRELARAGIEVKVFSGGRAAQFLNSQGIQVDDIVADSPPRVAGGTMTWATLWYLRAWLAHRSTLPRTRKLFTGTPPDLVVCDEEFSGLVVGEERRVRRAFISDELELGFARGWMAGKVEARVYRWYKTLQDSVDALIIPEDGVDQGNRKYVGPIVRGVTAGREDVRRRHGLPLEGSMVLLSLSGSGLGDYLIGPALKAVQGPGGAGSFLVITGNRGPRISAPGVHDLGLVPDNQDLVASADLVIANAGKSTIDEAAASGTPIVAIPIKNHAEQERNAAALGYRHDDLGRLGELIAQRLGKRGEPVHSAGAQKTVRLILSMI